MQGAKCHRISLAEKAIADWMKSRLESGEPMVSGFLHEGKLLFPAKEKQAGLVTIEPTAVFEGELSSSEDINRGNKEVKQTLASLAAVLKAKLKQDRFL